MFVWNCRLEVSRPREEEGIFFIFQTWSFTSKNLVKNKSLHNKKNLFIFLLTKFYQRGYFNEVGGNAKQTMILFWPNNIYHSRNLSCFYSLANTFCTILYRQTDGRMDKVIPIYPPNFVCWGIKNGKKSTLFTYTYIALKSLVQKKMFLIQVYQVDFTQSVLSTHAKYYISKIIYTLLLMQWEEIHQ